MDDVRCRFLGLPHGTTPAVSQARIKPLISHYLKHLIAVYHSFTICGIKNISIVHFDPDIQSHTILCLFTFYLYCIGTNKQGDSKSDVLLCFDTKFKS